MLLERNEDGLTTSHTTFKDQHLLVVVKGARGGACELPTNTLCKLLDADSAKTSKPLELV
jgi:hypothetical protein